MDSRDAQCADVAANCLCFNLRKATRLLTQLYDAALRPSGLRVTQFTVLVAIQLGGAVPMQVLAGALGMDRTTLTRNLKALEDRDLVTSGPGRDRRSRLISLTDEGRQVVDATLPLWREAQQQAVEALGAERTAQLMPLLGHISASSSAAIAADQTSGSI